MRRRFVALAPDDSLREAEALMRMGRFRALPVVAADRLEGMLHYAPMVRWCLGVGSDAPGSLLHRLDGTPVAALMDAKPVHVPREMRLEAAAERLAASEVGCLPVVDAAGRVVGIVADSDLLRFAFPPAELADPT
jgi:acetoin utilization protein AcuB